LVKVKNLENSEDASMKKTYRRIHILTLMVLLLSSAFTAEASFFGSDALASYKSSELEGKDLLPVISLMAKDVQHNLHEDNKKFELFIRKEMVRKYLIDQAHKQGLADHEINSLQMRVSAEHELYRLYVMDKTKIPDAYPKDSVIRQVYDKNRSKLMTPKQVHLRQIFLPVDAKHSLKHQLNELHYMLHQIKAGKKTFAAYAKSHSKHKASAKKGGDLGWVSVTSLIPEFKKELDSMHKNKAHIVKSSKAVRLVELLGTHPAKAIPFDRVKDNLRVRLRAQKQNESEQQYLSKLLKDNPVSIKDFALLRQALDSHDRSAYKDKMHSIIASMGNVKLDLAFFIKQVKVLEALQGGQHLNMDDAFVKQKLITTLLLKQFIVATARAQKFDQSAAVKLQVSRASDDVLVQAMLESLSKLPSNYPSQQQLGDAYRANKTKLVRPDMDHLGQIYVARSKDDKQNKKLSKALQDLHKLLTDKPELFSSLAKKYSQHAASKAQGGDMGWLKQELLLPDVLKAIKSMQPGAISPVINSKDGWRIVKFFGHKNAGVIPLAEAKPALVKAMKADELKQRIQTMTQQLLTSKSISIDADERNKLLKSL